MTPAQLDALATVHTRVNNPNGERPAGPEEGTIADLLTFQAMPRSG